MSSTVPPVPSKTPLTTSNGLLTDAWAMWFRQAFQRLGGGVASSNADIDAEIVTLSSQISALQSNINDLNSGPNL